MDPCTIESITNPLGFGSLTVQILELDIALCVRLHVRERCANGDSTRSGGVLGELGEGLEKGVERRVVVRRGGKRG